MAGAGDSSGYSMALLVNHFSLGGEEYRFGTGGADIHSEDVFSGRHDKGLNSTGSNKSPPGRGRGGFNENPWQQVLQIPSWEGQGWVQREPPAAFST